MSATVQWNDRVKLIVSDVDETIADLYVDSTPAMVRELEALLAAERVLFLVSGQSVQSIERRVVAHVAPHLRRRILAGHCSGAEVWGFDGSGALLTEPYYSLYESALSDGQKVKWREATRELVHELGLKVYPAMPVPQFIEASRGDPGSVMLEDRGPQITLEVVNGGDRLRDAIVRSAAALLQHYDLPVTPRLAGVFAVDFAIRGVSKSTAVRYVIENAPLLHALGLSEADVRNPEVVEVWGDRFSATNGGTDRHLSEALPVDVRSISFRDERPEEFLPGYNTVLWDGEYRLHEGLLEFLRSRTGGRG